MIYILPVERAVQLPWLSFRRNLILHDWKIGWMTDER